MIVMAEKTETAALGGIAASLGCLAGLQSLRAKPKLHEGQHP